MSPNVCWTWVVVKMEGGVATVVVPRWFLMSSTAAKPPTLDPPAPRSSLTTPYSLLWFLCNVLVFVFLCVWFCVFIVWLQPTTREWAVWVTVTVVWWLASYYGIDSYHGRKGGPCFARLLLSTVHAAEQEKFRFYC